MHANLVREVLIFLGTDNMMARAKKISFICHSFGGIICRAALAHEEFKPLLPKLHTLITLPTSTHHPAPPFPSARLIQKVCSYFLRSTFYVLLSTYLLRSTFYVLRSTFYFLLLPPSSSPLDSTLYSIGVETYLLLLLLLTVNGKWAVWSRPLVKAVGQGRLATE